MNHRPPLFQPGNAGGIVDKCHRHATPFNHRPFVSSFRTSQTDCPGTGINYFTPKGDNGFHLSFYYHLANMPQKQKRTRVEGGEFRFNSTGNDISENKHRVVPFAFQFRKGTGKFCP